MKRAVAVRIPALLACLALLSLGCSHTRWPEHLGAARGYLEKGLEYDTLVRVKPWEREVLGREDMSWAPDRLQSTRRSHIYFSKEASLVGGSAGGGGCGCN